MGSGRPVTEFLTLSERSKRRRTESIRCKSIKELSFATQMKLRGEGKLDAANVVKNVTLGSPTKGEKYRRSVEFVKENSLSPDSALSLLIELKLSKNQYLGMRAISKQNNCKLYPRYQVYK